MSSADRTARSQRFSLRDELVKEGEPVVLLHARQGQNGIGDSGPAYDAIVFVPAGEGQRIELGDAVEVVPVTVKREEHGFIRGRVTSVGKLPASKHTLEEALGNPELADEFLKQYPREGVLQVTVKLDEVANPDRHQPVANRFRWSTESGGWQRLKTATMCEAAIVIERRRLIGSIIPWSKKLFSVN